MSNLKRLERERAFELAKEEARRKARESYSAYWQYVNPKFYVGSHIDVILDACDDLINGDLIDENGDEVEILVLSAPPQHGKSESTVKCLPSYVTQKFEMFSTIIVAYGDSLAMGFARQNKYKINDYDVFEEDTIETLKASEADMEFSNGSSIRARGILSGITGNPADLIIVDDPNKTREEANSPTRREKIWDEFRDSIMTRLSAKGKVIVIMTRWHEDDLVGRIVARKEYKSLVLNFPCEAEENDMLGREVGEALFPEIGKNDKWVANRKNQLINDPKEGGLMSWLSLYQGRPTSQEGNLLRRRDWQYYIPRDSFFRSMPVVALSVDASFKDLESSDFVAIQVWGKQLANMFLMDRVKKRMDFYETLREIQKMLRKHPYIGAKYIEDKANGSAIISMLNRTIGGFIGINPRGSKIARVQAMLPYHRAHNIYVPNKEIDGYEWVNEFEDECASFPNGTHDDDVDAFSQAINELITVPAIPDKNLLPYDPVFDRYGRTNDDEFDEAESIMTFGRK